MHAHRIRMRPDSYLSQWCYELLELADAVRCAGGLVQSPVDLTLVPEHHGGCGALYRGLNRGRIEVRSTLPLCLSSLRPGGEVLGAVPPGQGDPAERGVAVYPGPIGKDRAGQMSGEGGQRRVAMGCEQGCRSGSVSGLSAAVAESRCAAS